MLYVDRAVFQFWKRLVWITTVKGRV